MKLLFIPAKSKLKISLNFQALPKKLGLVATVQFVDSLKGIKNQLEQQGKQVLVGKAKALEPGQVIGCNVEAATSVQNKVQAFLYIGSGTFHPLAIALALKKQKPIFIFNPETQQLTRFDEKIAERAKGRQKTAKAKFLSSNRFGILVSTKPGQERLKQALELKKKLESQGKKCYIFIFDDFNSNQLENFPSIECWVNSACHGLSLEQPFIWIGDIK